MTRRERNRVYFLPPKNKGNSGTTLPKLSKHLPMGRCLGRVEETQRRAPKGRSAGTKFHRRFVVIPTDLSSDPITCGVRLW
ncbi:hypothetical protein BUQ74_12755 [Leptospira weilii serovar Heyan]|nr:hypothetical protein BUQ74_12755 [Leptospira weilii serovar Heyan]